MCVWGLSRGTAQHRSTAVTPHEVVIGDGGHSNRAEELAIRLDDGVSLVFAGLSCNLDQHAKPGSLVVSLRFFRFFPSRMIDPTAGGCS